jgi:hypothetical protein
MKSLTTNALLIAATTVTTIIAAVNPAQAISFKEAETAFTNDYNSRVNRLSVTLQEDIDNAKFKASITDVAIPDDVYEIHYEGTPSFALDYIDYIFFGCYARACTPDEIRVSESPVVTSVTYTRNEEIKHFYFYSVEQSIFNDLTQSEVMDLISTATDLQDVANILTPLDQTVLGKFADY